MEHPDREFEERMREEDERAWEEERTDRLASYTPAGEWWGGMGIGLGGRDRRGNVRGMRKVEPERGGR
jgi:hypothetical protein